MSKRPLTVSPPAALGSSAGVGQSRRESSPTLDRRKGRKSLAGWRKPRLLLSRGLLGRPTLAAIALITLLWLVFVQWASIPLLPSPSPWSAGPGVPVIPPDKHPIDVLIKRAEEGFDKLKASQSRTLGEAVAEYKRRYARNPPKGFDKWFEYAQERGLILIDEFDTISRDLEPFWGLSPAQIEERRKSLLESAKSDHFLSITIRSGVVDDEDGPASSKKWPQNKEFHKFFTGFSDVLPDMNLVLNLFDLPVSFVSYEERQRLITAGKRGVYAPDSEEIPPNPELVSETKGFAFEDLRAACPPSSPARQYYKDQINNTIYPPEEITALAWRLPREQGSFIYNHKAAGDICHNPALRNQHGNFLGPYLDLKMKRNRLYPVFSWSRYAVSSDIAIPTNYRFQWDKSPVAEWADMKPAIAWRGTLTGMFADSMNVIRSHRHALMLRVQYPEGTEEVVALNRQTGKYELTTMTRSRGAEWVDIGIKERSYNRHSEAEKWVLDVIKPSETYMDNKQRSLYKMLLDVDGWGWSARYRELLRTPSAVAKATVFHEIITDWLIPWYHYIPVNYDYTDLYSILLYFFGKSDAGQPAHDAELEAIADRSKEWADSQLGWEQQKVYVYRLCLEWARLCSEDRASMDHKG